MARWTVAVKQMSLTRGAGSDEVAYKRRVNAKTRRDAVTKCMPDIKRLPIDPSIRIIAIFCGKTNSVTESAFRLMPTRYFRSEDRLV